MVCSVPPLPFRHSDASSRADSGLGNQIPVFTRQASPLRNTDAEISGVRDKGGIEPGVTLHEQVVFLARKALSLGNWGAGAQGTCMVGLGPTLAGCRMFTNVAEIGNAGNDIHVTIMQNQVPLHELRFMHTDDGGAQVMLNGRILTPMSSMGDLRIAQAVANKL